MSGEMCEVTKPSVWRFMSCFIMVSITRMGADVSKEPAAIILKGGGITENWCLGYN